MGLFGFVGEVVEQAVRSIPFYDRVVVCWSGSALCCAAAHIPKQQGSEQGSYQEDLLCVGFVHNDYLLMVTVFGFTSDVFAARGICSRSTRLIAAQHPH